MKLIFRRYQKRAVVLLHEMAHMWFGNLVTPVWWDGLWLNEAFAQYLGYMACSEISDSHIPWLYFNDMKRWAFNQDILPSTHPIQVDVHTTDDVFLNFDGYFLYFTYN